MSDTTIPPIIVDMSDAASSETQRDDVPEEELDEAPAGELVDALDSTRSLAARAAELQRLANDHAIAREGAVEFQQLKTRADELTVLATRAANLAAALAQLDSLADVPSVPRDGIAPARAKVQKLKTKVKKEGISALLVSRALLALGIEDAIAPVEQRALSAWRAFVQSGFEAGGLEIILGKYPGYRAAAGPIAEKRVQLSGYAKALPTAKTTVLEVARLRGTLAEAMKRAVTDQGLSEHVVKFLGRAVDGVSLAEVLGDPEVVAWLKDRDHAAAFKLLPR